MLVAPGCLEGNAVSRGTPWVHRATHSGATLKLLLFLKHGFWWVTVQQHFYIFVSLFVGNPKMAGLASKVHHRLQLAYRPNTTTNYMGHFKAFMSYCVFYHINLQELREFHLLGFLEFLAHSGLSHFTISNYLAGLKAMFHRFGLPVTLLHSKNISLILQSFSKSLKYSPKPKGVFNIQQLLSIIQLTSKFPHSRIFKAIFLLAFLGFFRLSNLVPVTSASFDPVRHLTSSDLIWAPPGVHVLLKWSKTIQSVSQYKTIPLAQIGNSPLCPISALLEMLGYYMVPKNAPLFSYKNSTSLVVITQSQVQSTLASILKYLNLPSNHYGFHTFRRSAASLAFQLNVPIQNIKTHGTWASDTVWAYIQPSMTTSPVTTAFKNHLQH